MVDQRVLRGQAELAAPAHRHGKVDWAAGHLRRHHGAVPEVHAEEREQLRQAAFADLDAVVEIVQQGVSFGVQPDVPDPALVGDLLHRLNGDANRSEEHTSELQSLMRISYAVFCLKKKMSTKASAPRTS